MHQVHSLQPSSTPKCARLAVSWAAWPCRGRGPRSYRSPSRCVAALTRAPCPRPLRALPCVSQASMAVSHRTGCRIVGVCCARTWPCRGLGRNTALPSALLLVTIRHGVLRYSVCLAYPLPVTIQFGLYLYMLIPQLAYLSVTIQPVYCDTLFLSHQALAVTIQKLYHDTAY